MRVVGSSMRELNVMMTEVEFLARFQRQEDGSWACTRPIRVDGPSGPIMIEEGASFGSGDFLLGINLAKELDQMAAKQRFLRKSSQPDTHSPHLQAAE
jgi:hypothetical protein